MLNDSGQSLSYKFVAPQCEAIHRYHTFQAMDPRVVIYNRADQRNLLGLVFSFVCQCRCACNVFGEVSISDPAVDV